MRRMLHTLSPQSLLLAQTLVRMNTVSANSNLQLIDFAQSHLAALGVKSRITYNAERTKANLFATLGEGKPAGVIVSGHTDTVPWDGQDWSVDPLSAVVQNEKLYGRGSADMKSFIAIALANAHRFLESDSPFAVHFAFSYEEEIGCFGVKRAHCRHARRRHQAAGLHRRRAHQHGAGHRAQGRLPLQVLRARQGGAFVAHAASRSTPSRWRRALVGKVRDMAERLRARGAPLRGLRRAVLHRQRGPVPWRHRRQRGATRRRVPLRVPRPAHRRCAAHAGRGCGPCGHAGAGHEAGGARRRASGSRPSARFPSFLGSADDPVTLLAQRLASEDRTTLVAFGTEAGLFKNAGIPTVVCGPGSIEQAHQPDEYVSLEQLARCELFMERLATSPTIG
jgi:acetylornithine deacetylase